MEGSLKKRKWFKAIPITLSVLIMVGMGGTSTLAESLKELEKKHEEIKQQQKEVNENINAATENLKAIQSELDKIVEQLTQLDAEMANTNKKINEKEKEIKDTQAEIDELNQQIKDLEERIKKRDELLKQRAQTIQETGGNISYLEVLLGAKSFTDFISRVSAVTVIIEADKAIIEEHKQDKIEVEKSKEKVEAKLASLEKAKEDLESYKQSIKQKQSEKNVLLAELQEKEHDAHADILSYEEEQKILADQQAALAQSIALEKKRIEEEKKRKEEEERRKREENNNNGGNNDNGGGDLPAISDREFTRPTTGYISSGFGYRWGSFHYGVDIANSKGTPVVASGDGYVYSVRTGCPDVAGKSSGHPDRRCGGGFGNRVFILHTFEVNGEIYRYTTIYAHLSAVLVSDGQWVKKGQVIGKMGNTGDSYGNHLHFEVHPGGYGGHSTARNPLDYVDF